MGGIFAGYAMTWVLVFKRGGIFAGYAMTWVLVFNSPFEKRGGIFAFLKKGKNDGVFTMNVFNSICYF